MSFLKSFDRLHFGSAGIPLCTEPRSTENGIKEVNSLGLSAMELEFVRQVNISEKKAPEIKEIAQKNNVNLSCHGQYFINLNSQEKAKIEASKFRIYNAAKIASLCGASTMTFHAAYYMKMDKEPVYNLVKKHLSEVTKKLQDEGHFIWVRPETTGKGTQFGDVDEIVKLSNDVEGVLPCVDFSHLFARSIGKINSYDTFSAEMAKIEKGLGKKAIKNMHIHVSGMNYGPKGERNHLILSESDLKYKAILKVLKDFKAKGILISESPNIEQDALLMQNTFRKL